MECNFNKMSQQQAEYIASNWHYEGKYSFYDIAADEDDLAELLNPQERGDKCKVNSFKLLKGALME